MEDLSKDFSLEEFACKCGKCGLPKSVHPALLAGLQRMRDQVNLAITINSGGRCVEHNQAVGGAGKSEHIVTPEDPICKAADVEIDGMTSEQAFKVAETVPEFENAGIGVYDPDKIVHVDVREHKARWGRDHGKYVSLDLFFARPQHSIST
jgi:uncharacterized protein YcbK (DUF882 family)